VGACDPLPAHRSPGDPAGPGAVLPRRRSGPGGSPAWDTGRGISVSYLDMTRCGEP